METIALPAISAGMYGFPIDLCAHVIVEAVTDFLRKHTSTTLKEVRFTSIESEHSKAFQNAMKAKFGMDLVLEGSTSAKSKNVL